MSGEKKNTDKAQEIFDSLLFNDDFKQDLEGLKKHTHKYNKDHLTDYLFRQYHLLEKYNVIPTQRLQNIIYKYVFKREALGGLGDYFPVRLQAPSEEELEKTNRAFLKLWLYDGVTEKEFLAYVKKQWKVFKILLESQSMPKVKRIRKIENKEQINFVRKYCKMPIKELRQTIGNKNNVGVRREVLISRLAQEEGYSVTIDSTKGMINRYCSRKSNT